MFPPKIKGRIEEHMFLQGLLKNRKIGLIYSRIYLKAFYHTIKYFLTNAIEFELKGLMKCEIVKKDSINVFCLYDRQIRVRPPMTAFKTIIDRALIAYLNYKPYKKQFTENIKRIKLLPDGTKYERWDKNL